MSSPDLDGLIIDHLCDIDASVKRLVELQGEVFQAVMDEAAEWARKSGWAGKFDYLGEEGCWLAPPDWRVPGSMQEDDDFSAYFQMELGAGDTDNEEPNEDHFYLTRLCGEGVGQIGFRFRQSVLTSKVKWKRCLKDQVELVTGKTAFLIDTEPSFFLAVKLDTKQLAFAVRDEDINVALDPFRKALEQLDASKKTFDKVLAATNRIAKEK
jgi:hypothetical protein